jgi:hypothetical protein
LFSSEAATGRRAFFEDKIRPNPVKRGALKE